MMKFSLVSTVFNESERLVATIQDIEQQTLQPSEIIITDAGSTDGTYGKLKEWQKMSKVPVVLLQKERCNVAEGRNMAIRAARYPVIASMDFGCRLENDWLESIMFPFYDDTVDIVGGAYGVKKSEQETIAAKAAYIYYNGHQLNFKHHFLPSSRSIAYKKKVYDSIGGYCEWLTLAADDTVFAMEACAKKYKMIFTRQVGVFWGRHKTAKGFIKEASRYGLGDGEARIGKKGFFITLAETKLRYWMFISLLLILLLFSLERSIPLWLLGLPLLFSPGLRAYYRYLESWRKFGDNNIKALFYGFYLLERIKLSYLKGYVKGYFYSSTEQKRKAGELGRRLKINSRRPVHDLPGNTSKESEVNMIA